MVAPFPRFNGNTEKLVSGAGVDSQSHGVRPPVVSILMCTYNGERFLSEQLESIARQTFRSWNVVVSDDGSTDSTLHILQRYSELWGEGRLTIQQGPRRGFAANFMSVACDSPVQSQFYAWADQDDIWQDTKLELAMTALQAQSTDTPVLYCARTELIGETGTVIGISPRFPRPASFANALVQSIAGGNTMVFNQSTLELFRLGGTHLDIVSHDWWAYLLVTGVGGKVLYDVTPSILYRQHDANLIGANSGTLARIARLRMMSTGRFRNWNDRNIAALESVRSRLTVESLQTLEQFKKARESKGLARFIWLFRSRVYRQTYWGNLGLILAMILNRI